MPTFYIRKAQADDLYDIAELELRSAQHEQRLYPLDCSINHLHDIWYQRFLSGKYEILLAETRKTPSGKRNSTIAGFVGFTAPLYKSGFIQAMYVDPFFFRKRVGIHLFYAAEQIMLSHGCPAVTLHVEPKNVAGHRFYTKLGFVCQNYRHQHLFVLSKNLHLTNAISRGFI